MPAQIVLRFNGVCHAYLREFGCRHCPQCSPDKPRANTSASLLILRRTPYRWQLCHHLLFDCGSGVTDSLIGAGVDVVHHLFVSHCHFDHFLEVERLTSGQRRSEGPHPVSLYCTQETWEKGPHASYPWLKATHRPVRFFEPVGLFQPGTGEPIADGLGVHLRITPVPVWHGPSAPGATIWVIEFGDPATTTYHKLIFAWDMLHLIPRYPEEDSDGDYTGPVHESASLDERHASLLTHADELFIDANTCETYPAARHTSILAALRCHIPRFRPARTWFVHYSGHEDPGGPLSDEHLQAQLDRQTAIHHLRAGSLQLARHGMTLRWEV